MTIGQRIYLQIALGFIGLAGATLFESRQMGAGLRHQKEVELKHLSDLAIGIVKEEYDASERGELSVAEAQARAQSPDRQAALWR